MDHIAMLWIIRNDWSIKGQYLIKMVDNPSHVSVMSEGGGNAVRNILDHIHLA